MTNEYLVVDGYNIIFSWDKLAELARDNLEAARIKLADILCNYQGFQRIGVILVFDGYQSKGNTGSILHYHNIDIVYTKEAETADQFIEMVAQRMARQCIIRVATSDATEQIVILGKGAVRMSAREFAIEMEETQKRIQEVYEEKAKQSKQRNHLMDNLSPEMAELMEKMRLQK